MTSETKAGPDTTNESPPHDVVSVVKQEKFDPEIEARIKLVNIKIKQEKETTQKGGENGANDNDHDDEDDDDDGSDDDSNDSNSTTVEHVEDKKLIEPVKSSNEILAELFKVFNATPPKEILDDKSLLKKNSSHKKHKKGKKNKKHKKGKSDGERSDSDVDDAKETGEKSRHKKKKHKHKHSDVERHRDRSIEKDKERLKGSGNHRDRSDREKSRDRDKRSKTMEHMKREMGNDGEKERVSNERKRHISKDSEYDKGKRPCLEDVVTNSRIENNVHNGHRERRKGSSRDREVKIKKEPQAKSSQSSNNNQMKEDSHISDISLSDEETYLKERERDHETSTARQRRHGHEGSRVHNSFYAGSECRRSHERSGDTYSRSRTTRRRYSSRSRSRSRERSRSRDLGIDKKRLLEIARKNAISMFKRGSLPGCDNMSQEIKDKVLLKMRYGGRTVQDLTDFCKKISNGENLSDLSSDEDSDVDKNGNAKAFHHPFLLKEREPIVMHIRNAKPITPRMKTDDQTKAITMQFPVSSGQQHRLTEAWVPILPKEKLAPLPALPAATQSTTIFKSAPKNVLGKSMPVEGQQEPAFRAVAPAAPEINPTPITNPSTTSATPQNNLPPPSATSSVDTSLAHPPLPLPHPPASKTFVPDVPIPSTIPTSESVFPQSTGSALDVSSIISKRLNAMRRLQENPRDSEAMKMMYNSQQEMSSWASSKHLPGQFTGSTGANVLKPSELNSGPQVWARRDQLTSTQPVTGGMGMQLLQKMGWKPGEGLGREKTGSLQPLLLDVKLDKRGLISKEDLNGYRRPQSMQKKHRGNHANAGRQNLQDKHPVCLLNELTSKRKWTPPLYTLINEAGPSHNKLFLFSVSINGQTFTPDKASNTKKEAKMLAARNCLQRIGILPGN